MQKTEVKLDDDTWAAVCGFGARVGVAPADVLAVMVGLSEQEKRERSGVLRMTALLLRCQEALRAKPGRRTGQLADEIDAALTASG